MTVLYRGIVVLGVCILFGMMSYVHAQQLPDKVVVSEPPFPVSDEAIDLATYPLEADPELGVSVARLGEGKIFQLEVTLVEIPAGGRVRPERHLAEEYIYVVSGEGYTDMWVRPGEKPQRYTWKAGDFLSPSLNSWHQHFNTATTPARYLSLTTMPLSRNVYHDDRFITGIDYIFEDRWQQGITQKPEYKSADSMNMKAGHYLADLPGMKLQPVEDRWGVNLRPDGGDMAGNRLLEAFIRDYHDNSMGVPSEGDRHPWEKVYLGLEGEGAAVLKPMNGAARVVNWKKGQLFFVEGYEHHDIGPRFGSVPKPPYPRIMQMKAPGYFDDVGNSGGTEYTRITGDDVLFVVEED